MPDVLSLDGTSISGPSVCTPRSLTDTGSVKTPKDESLPKLAGLDEQAAPDGDGRPEVAASPMVAAGGKSRRGAVGCRAWLASWCRKVFVEVSFFLADWFGSARFEERGRDEIEREEQIDNNAATKWMESDSVRAPEDVARQLRSRFKIQKSPSDSSLTSPRSPAAAHIKLPSAKEGTLPTLTEQALQEHDKGASCGMMSQLHNLAACFGDEGAGDADDLSNSDCTPRRRPPDGVKIRTPTAATRQLYKGEALTRKAFKQRYGEDFASSQEMNDFWKSLAVSHHSAQPPGLPATPASATVATTAPPSPATVPPTSAPHIPRLALTEQLTIPRRRSSVQSGETATSVDQDGLMRIPASARSSVSSRAHTLVSWGSRVGSDLVSIRSLEDLDNFFSAEVSGDYHDRDWQRFPLFVVSQSTICFLLWVCCVATGVGSEGHPFLFARGGLDSLRPYSTTLQVHDDCEDLRPQLYRWVLYQYTHIGFFHVLLNCCMVCFLGIALEGFQGHFRMFLLFNAGVLGGAMWMAVANPHIPSTVGMSGGCYAIFGLNFADLIMNWNQSKYRRVKLPMLLLLAVADSVQVAFTQGGGLHVNHSVHLGGFLVGLIWGIIAGRQWTARRYKRVARTLAALLGVGFFVFGACWIAQWPPRGLWDPEPWCWARQVQHSNFFGSMRWQCVRCADQECIDAWKSRQGAPDHIQKVNAIMSCQCDGCWGHTGTPRFNGTGSL